MYEKEIYFTIPDEVKSITSVSDAASGTTTPVFRPRYAVDHHTDDLEEQEARKEVASNASSEQEAEALTAIQQKWEAELA